MPTRVTETQGVAPAAKQVAEHASSLARLELELATLELKRKIGALGLGIGLVAGAGVFLLFALGFAFAAGAAALATVVAAWLALLIVGGGLVVFAGLLALFGLKSIKASTPPVPKQAVEEAKLITEALKRNGNR